MAFDVSFIYRIIDRYTPQLRKIAGATKKLQRTVGGVAGSIDRFGNKLRNAGSFAGAAASGFAALAISFPVKKAMDFEDAVTNLDKAFDFKNEGQRAGFIADIKSMGPRLGKTATEMANLSFEAGKLNIPMDEVQQFTGLAAKASVAFDGLPIEEAGQTIGDLKNKFKLGIDGVEGMLDSINTLADNTTANGGQILKVVGRMSGIFSSLEVPPEVAAGLSTFARQVTVSDELAASGLKQFTQKLIEGGLQADLMADPMGTILGVMKQIQAVPEGNRGNAIIDTFGLEAAPFVTALVSNSGLLADTMANVADKTNFAGSMQSEFNRQSQTTSFRWGQIKAKFDLMVVTLGEKLLPAFNDLIDRAEPLLEKATDFIATHPGFVKIAAAVAAIVAIMIPLAIVIGTVLLVLNPITLIVMGIVGAFAAASLAVWAWYDDAKAVVQGFTDIFNPMFDWLERKFEGVGSMISAAADLLGFGDDTNVNVAGTTELVDGTREMAANAQASRASNLSGQIGIAVTGPGKVTESRLRSDAPGNLGFNVGMVGAH